MALQHRTWWQWLTGTTPTPPEVAEAERCFTEQELQAIRSYIQSVLKLQSAPVAGSSKAAAPPADGLTEAFFLRHLCHLGGDACSPELGTALFHAVAARGNSGDSSGYVSEAHVILAKARCERMTDAAAREFAFSVIAHMPPQERTSAHQQAATPAAGGGASSAAAAAPGPATHVSAAQLHAAITAAAAYALGLAPKIIPESSVSAVVAGALRCEPGSGSSSEPAAPAAAAGGVPTGTITIDGFLKWCKTCPAVAEVLTSLLRRVGAPGPQVLPAAGHAPAAAPAAGAAAAAAAQHAASVAAPAGPHASAAAAAAAAATKAAATTAAAAVAGPPAAAPRVPMPRLLIPERYPSTHELLLQPLWQLLLSRCLASDMRQEWRLLFNSQRDGASFNTFIGRLSALPGPTLLLVRDKGGHLMGGFAPAAWAKNGAFFGDASTFIFGLEPVMQVFPATGINRNFQWCGTGFSQLPNGLGFGGAQGGPTTGQFALYIDSTLDSGMSRPIATFGNPSLSSSQVCQIDTVECWLVKQPEEEEAPGSAASAAAGSSVLVKRAQDRSFMNLAGVQINHSAGVMRDEPIECE